MSYRVLCDENIPSRTVQYLERDGHRSVHVNKVLAPGTDDDVIAKYARENEMVILTNDADFLDDNAFPDTKLFYCPDNRATAYELASMVSEAVTYFPHQSELPSTFFLTD